MKDCYLPLYLLFTSAELHRLVGIAAIVKPEHVGGLYFGRSCCSAVKGLWVNGWAIALLIQISKFFAVPGCISSDAPVFQRLIEMQVFFG